MKLHLGCGEKYLKGFVNIDFPSKFHTIQNKSVADKYANIFELKYKKDSIEEIRLHHVFEHFERSIALGLIAGWRSWLKKDGILRIEVPDFDRSIGRVLNFFSDERAKCVALRHIFGSQEASWAKHCEGWSPKRLKKILILFGFNIVQITKNSWKNTYNFEIIATRIEEQFNQQKCEQIAKKILKKYLVDNSESELRLLSVWMNKFKKQIKQIWAMN
ncbi:MAG: hypothetical protein ABII99_02405 [Patescibacteria group bacterium]|nr:hypothetical protein [bacterium]MBU1349521.1 hypothetical protein [Patescibacteria group bacterium]MBU1421526.1 hypothetical protein [Patescibacteria group bacterium]MBU1987456.1 hypothetical protein [Patescibacteria group bacterium]MBU2415704.1 hypothetical protein [Patescibacteria group bacterium]